MKTTKMVMILMAMAVTAFAQDNDDMYFNSKDRVKSNEANLQAMAKKYQQEDLDAVRTAPVNPSDSYSGRGINPEYNAQGKNGTAVIQNDPDYFLTTYQPTGVNQNLYQGNGSYANPNNCNCAYQTNSPYSGLGYGGFGNPYSYYSSYASMYSPYGMGGMGMYSPYYYPGLSMSIGMGSMYGMGMGSMYGMGMGMGSMYGMGMGSMYGMGMYGGYGMPYYPTYVTYVGNSDSRHYVNQRHPSRSSGQNFYTSNTRPAGSVVGGNGRADGGRVRTNGSNYYDSGWRGNSSNFTSRSAFGQGAYSGSRTSWGNSGGRSAFDSFGGAGSRSSFGGGGAIGGGASSGGGGGHSRGRH